MTGRTEVERIPPGVANLESLIQGGFPRGSMTVIAGPPGSGKTILAQQICFSNASAAAPCVYFNTLSEPTAKSLQYLSLMRFFDVARVEHDMHFVDLGGLLTAGKLDDATGTIMEHVHRVRPGLVVVDSFKCFDDLAASPEELRRFSHRTAIEFMAWGATVFLVGEYSPAELETNPLFGVVDGVIMLTQSRAAGEQQRLLQVVKMRGTAHSRDEHAFRISRDGLHVFSPRALPSPAKITHTLSESPCHTRIAHLDELFGGGVPWGSSVLVAGPSGAGKTVTSLEFLYRGALAGENGILFSFGAESDRHLRTARGFGWDLAGQIASGRIRVVFVPHPDFHVDEELAAMPYEIEAQGARRVVIDSLTAFLHRIRDRQVVREKTFRIASIIRNAQAVGLLATDVSDGHPQLCRAEEDTVVDGVLLLRATAEGLDRHRYVEVYKLRDSRHLSGQHGLVIGVNGLEISPRYRAENVRDTAPRQPLDPGRRVASGICGLDGLLGGGLLEGSTTLVSGSAGTGKSTIALHFALAVRAGGSLFVSFDEGAAQIAHNARVMSLPVDAALAGGELRIEYLSGNLVRPCQLELKLSELVQESRATRVVLDGIGRLLPAGLPGSDLRNLLHALDRRFKELGVTSLLTLAVPELFRLESAVDRDVASTPDNLVLLRYRQTASELVSTLIVVKSRGTQHDLRTHATRMSRGGFAVVGPLDPGIGAGR